MLCPYLGFFVSKVGLRIFCPVTFWLFFDINRGNGTFCPFFEKDVVSIFYAKLGVLSWPKQLKSKPIILCFSILFCLFIHYFLYFILFIVQFSEKTGITQYVQRIRFPLLHSSGNFDRNLFVSFAYQKFFGFAS